MFDFDTVIDRRNTFCLKYDFAKERGKPEDVLPFWVADMDFRVAPCIIEALQKQAAHGIFGYSEAKDDYFNAIYNWFHTYFHWDVKREWLIKTPGVVPAICLAIRALTEKDDAIMIQTPVYYPFMASIENNGRRIVRSPLIRRGGKYMMNDLDDIERKIVENEVKLAILCSPHNPVGRVWTREELLQYSEICRRHNVRLIVDEIHCDFTYPGYTHTAFGTLGEADAMNAVICTAPSKTFNIAGLQNSNIWIPNPKIRKAFQRELDAIGYDQLNVMGLVACQAAYTGGREWLDEVKAYIKGNLDFVRSFLEEKLPKIKLVEPEGTYLLWIDCRYYGLSDQELESKILNDAHLWTDMGYIFGPEGSGYFRLNIACPRATLTQGLNQLYEAFKDQKPASHPHFI